MSTLKKCLVGGTLLWLSQGLSGTTYYDGCNTYYNSMVISNWEYGTYCGGTGNGCMECYDLSGQYWCVSTLPRRCGEQRLPNLVD